MKNLTSPALLSLSAPRRLLLLLAMTTIGIAIQLQVPDGTTIGDISITTHTGSGATVALPHSATVTTGPANATAISAPKSSTATSAPKSATASVPTNTTAQ